MANTGPFLASAPRSIRDSISGFTRLKGGGLTAKYARDFGGTALTVIGEDLIDEEGKFTQRFDATPGANYLVRPDQHLCARWRSFDAAAVTRAHQRALQR